ncbi:MAG TPA: hypothetical protein VK809_07115 [Bacteroidia bacterium]|jgi:hypothetical protein|nr:hypothetical protein [Bacteroidia bacterium]
MENKKIPFLLSFFFFSLTLPVFSQVGWDSHSMQSKNRLFLGFTYNVLPDIEKGPINIYPHFASDNTPKPPYPQEGNAAVFVFNTNFVSIGGKIRYNLIQFSSRFSLSLSTAPSFGIGFTVVAEPDIYQINPYANCSYNIPLLLELNYGNGATHNTFDAYGFFILAGIEYTGLLIKNNISNGDMMDENGDFYEPDYITRWTEAVIGLGVRYRNHKNVQREIFLKYGIGPERLYVSPVGEVESAHSWSLKLTLVRNF